MSGTNPLECESSPNPIETLALYPDNTAPENRIPDISFLCNAGQSPLLVSGILREVLINHFSDTQNLISPKLRKVFSGGGYFEESPSGAPPYSPLFVDTLDRWKPTHSESRLAIVLKEGDWTYQQLGWDGLAYTDLRTGTKSYAGLWGGTHTAFVLAAESGVAKILATEVAKLFLWQSQEIIKTMNFVEFKLTKLGATYRLHESHTSYVVPVDVSYIVGESWEASQDAPRLKQIKFSANGLLRDY